MARHTVRALPLAHAGDLASPDPDAQAIVAGALADWAAAARPGDVRVYHVGDTVAGWPVGRVAWQLAQQGVIALTQQPHALRSVGPAGDPVRDWQFLATRLSPAGAAALAAVSAVATERATKSPPVLRGRVVGGGA